METILEWNTHVTYVLQENIRVAQLPSLARPALPDPIIPSLGLKRAKCVQRVRIMRWRARFHVQPAREALMLLFPAYSNAGNAALNTGLSLPAHLPARTALSTPGPESIPLLVFHSANVNVATITFTENPG